MSSRYEEESERLARLPRAERFEALIEFPTAHTFKVIGRQEGLADAVQRELARLGHPGVCLALRPSSRGTYLSLTFTLEVTSGAELDALYSCLESLPGVACLL